MNENSIHPGSYPGLSAKPFGALLRKVNRENEMNNQFSSHSGVGQTVNLDFGNGNSLKDVTVDGVKFSEDGKVRYDILVPVGQDSGSTVIENVDSAFVVPVALPVSTTPEPESAA